MKFGCKKSKILCTVAIASVLFLGACSDSKSEEETASEQGTEASPTPQTRTDTASKAARSGDSTAANTISSETIEAGQLNILADLPDNKILTFWVNNENRKSFWANQYEGASWVGASSPVNADESISLIKSQSAPSGKVAVTWIQSDDSGSSLWASIHDGASWSEASQLSLKGSLSEYELVVTRSGEFLVVWNDNGQMWMNTYNGENWADAIDLDLTMTGSKNLNIQVTSDKKIILIWNTVKDNKRYLWTSAYFDGQWDSLKLLAQPEKEIELIKSSINYNNQLTLMWKEVSAESQDILVSKFIDNAWQDPETVLSSERPIKQESIIIHRNGKAVLTWVQSEDAYESIYSKNYYGSSWSKDPIIVAKNLENDSSYKVATDSFSGTHVVWTQSDGSMWMNTLESGSWTGILRLSAGSQEPILDYAISFNKAGRSYIIWSQKSSVWFKPGPN